MNVIEYQKLLDEMPSFGPSVKTHPMFWGEAQLRKLEDYKAQHPDEYAANQAIQLAEARYHMLQQERAAVQTPGDIVEDPTDISLQGLRRHLPVAFGGNVNPHYDLSLGEAEQAGLIPPAKTLRQLGSPEIVSDLILRELNDSRWREAAAKAQASGQFMRRSHEPQAQAEERIANARTAAIKHGVGTALNYSDALIPGSAELDKGLARGAGELATRAGNSLGMDIPADAASEAERYLDDAQNETPAGLKIAAGLVGGAMSPLNKIKGLGLLNGIDDAEKGVGVAAGALRGAARGAANSVLGGAVSDTVASLRHGLTDGKDLGVASRARALMNEELQSAPARIAAGGALGAVSGGAQGFSRGLRDQRDIGTQPFRDFESVGGTTSMTYPGGLRPTPEMEVYQKLRMPNQGNPSDAAAANFAEVTTELAKRRASGLKGAHGETNEAYYKAADDRDLATTPKRLVNDSVQQLRENRFSKDDVSGDLPEHNNGKIRQLIRDTSDPVVVDDFEASKLMEREGASRLDVQDAIKMGIVSPDEGLYVEGLGRKVPASQVPDTMNIVLQPRRMTARELDQVVNAWHVAKNESAVRRGGAAHPMYDQLYPAIREARSQFPGIPPITKGDEFEVIRGGGGETSRTSGWDMQKEAHHQEMSNLEGDLKRVGIQSTDFQPGDKGLRDQVATQMKRYGEPNALEQTQALDNLYLDSGIGKKPLETIRGLRLLEGDLRPESGGKPVSWEGLIAKKIQAGQYKFDPVSRGLGGMFGGLTSSAAPAVADPLTRALIELQQKDKH